MKRGKYFTLKLVSLGLIFHLWYMMSIFDIYFRTPVIHGMEPVPIVNATAPAHRLVLFVGAYTSHLSTLVFFSYHMLDKVVSFYIWRCFCYICGIKIVDWDAADESGSMFSEPGLCFRAGLQRASSRLPHARTYFSHLFLSFSCIFRAISFRTTPQS
jgi:hypothetical protein